MNHPVPKNEQKASDDRFDGRVDSQSPTWLARNYRNDESDFIVDQYRRRQEPPVAAQQAEGDAYENYRQRVMDRLREQDGAPAMRQQMPPLPPRPTMPIDDIQAQDRHFGNTRPIGEMYAVPGKNGGSANRFVLMAGVAAIVAGGAIGFAMTKYDQIAATASGMLQAASTYMPNQSAPVLVADRETTISKKPISIASLKVADVSGSLNSVIPLGLEADPAFASQELALKISGLPKSAYLSAGTKISDTTWLLKDGEENGINLVVPSSDTAKFDVSVAAIETKTGELAAPIKEMTVALSDPSLQIAPASAPPETTTGSVVQQPAAAATAIPMPIVPASLPQAAAPVALPAAKPVLTAEVTGLLEKGDQLFKSGDLVIARQFYNRAFQMGAADGATGVAKTYDPAIYTQMNVQGIAPDAALAAQWYEPAPMRSPSCFSSFQFGAARFSAPSRTRQAHLPHFPMPHPYFRCGQGNFLMPARTTRLPFSGTSPSCTAPALWKVTFGIQAARSSRIST